MAEFTQTMSGDSRYSIKLTVTEVIPSDYITTNKTNVNYTLTATKSGGSGYWSSSTINPVKVTINGTDVVNTNISYDFRNATPKTITLASGTVTGISHNADGTKTIAVSGYFKDSANSLGQATASGNLTLTTIPRASQPTLYDLNDNIRTFATLGENLKIEIARASSSFKHTLQIKIGNTTVETFTNIDAEKNPWSPAISTYAPYITTSSSKTATIVCTTYNGSTSLGTKSQTITINVPNNASTKPTASISVSKGDNVVPSSWGVYVKGKSKLNVTITGTPKYGTTISNYSSSANGGTYNTSTYTTSELTGSGQVRASVTDKRGFASDVATSSYTVIDYSAPLITTANAIRCNSDGTPNDEGTYIKYNFVGSISPVSNKNAKTFRLKWKPKNGSDTTVGTWTDSYTCNKTGILSGFSITTEYVFTFEAIDQFNSISTTTEVGTVADIFNFNPDGESLAFGGVSQRNTGENIFDMYKTTTFHKDTYVSNIRSINIFDGLLEQGGFSTFGEKFPDTGMYRNANKIAVQPSTKYTTSINGVAQQYVMFYYASDGSFISSGDNRTGTFTTPNNCYYVNFRCYIADYRSDFATLKVQMEFGEIATSYSPYQELNPDNFKNEEIVVGSIRSKNMFSGFMNGAYDSSTGVFNPATSGIATNKMPTKSSTTYCISGIGSGNTIRILYWNNGTYVTSETKTFSSNPVTVTTQGNYMAIQTSISATYSNVQIEEGSAKTNYMPYQNLDNEEIYTTGEIKIGTWIDGKPLYRKTYKMTNQNQSYSVANPSNVSEFTKLSVMQKDSDGAWIPSYYWNASDYLRIFDTSGYIQIRTSKANNSFTHYIVVEYTKTTD